MGKTSKILNLITIPALIASILFGYGATNKLIKTKNENKELNQINITAKAENEELRNSLAESIANAKTFKDALELANTRLAQLELTLAEKDNIILSLQEELARLQNQNTITKYTLQEAGMLGYFNLIDMFVTEEDASARVETLTTKVNNGEEIISGINYSFSEYSHYDLSLEFSNENIYSEYLILSRNTGLFNLYSIPEGVASVELSIIMPYVNEIKIIDNLNYKVGEKYSLFELPECLGNLEFECYEKTENTVKLRNSMSLSDNCNFADFIPVEDTFNYVEITKTENSYIVTITMNGPGQQGDSYINYPTQVVNEIYFTENQVEPLQVKLNSIINEKEQLENEKVGLQNVVNSLQSTLTEFN